MPWRLKAPTMERKKVIDHHRAVDRGHSLIVRPDAFAGPDRSKDPTDLALPGETRDSTATEVALGSKMYRKLKERTVNTRETVVMAMNYCLTRFRSELQYPCRLSQSPWSAGTA